MSPSITRDFLLYLYWLSIFESPINKVSVNPFVSSSICKSSIYGYPFKIVSKL